MSRKGDCWDNAMAKSFFKTLKVELGSRFTSRQQARRDLLEERKADLAGEMARLASSDRRAELQLAVEHAFEVELNARRDLRNAEDRLAAEAGALDLLEATVSGSSQVGLVVAPPAGRDYCTCR